VSLALGRRLKIRAMVQVAGEPIPYFWPMRTFIHHNPLHGLEHLPFAQAVVQSAAVRAQPIALTALAAMMGAFFILDDPIFNGLAVSLIFGIAVSTLLTLVVIPVLYYAIYRRRYAAQAAGNA